jgi:hypothetical protein
MSSESGYGPEDGHTNPREQFFSYGGFNPQPNLLDNSIAYLRRGQVPHFLRAFWNTYGISIYPDIQCFAEACSYGMGGGPLYKTPDESKFIRWMRLMLVMEMGDDLWLGRGVPKAWMANGKTVELRRAPTYFGPMDLKITSAVAGGEIRAEIRPPRRDPPKSIRLFLRHPDGAAIKSVKVNGETWSQFSAATGALDLVPGNDALTIIARY